MIRLVICRSQASLRTSIRTVYSSTQRKNAHEKTLLRFIGAQSSTNVVASAIALCLLCGGFISSDGFGPNLSKIELADALKMKLLPVRNSLKQDGIQVPVITVRSMTYVGRNGIPTDTQILDMVFSPTGVDIVRLATHLLSVINPLAINKNANKEHINRLCQFYSSKSESTLSIVSEDKKSSITFGKSIEPVRGTNKREHKVGLAVFKDGGFSRAEADVIAKGYAEAFASDKPTDNSHIPKQTLTPIDSAVQRPVYQFAAVSSGANNKLALPPGIFSMLPELSEWFHQDATGSRRADRQLIFETSDGFDDSFNMVHGGRRPAARDSEVFDEDESLAELTDEEARVDAAMRALQSLGAEVFDRNSGRHQALTWDSLAGYDHVKAHIQSTIVDALQFPDIYDGVASKTRVVFESNRPKAVLLEGPPGTGKTLTARILASQCDRPLVVIKLESIVSKWFGESEKTLAKILDACDALDGAIVFVDEVDSLAQNRESEGGIHEVSKRILSVLLQRIEGFHGKGRSVLVAATNRKQDLDSALLSRFDLIIPFTLPDHHTRREILRRYARQFEPDIVAHSSVAKSGATDSKESPYEILATATEGLSCRAIKEICEQAERACASRLVAQKRATMLGGSSSSGDGDHDTKGSKPSSGFGLFGFGSSSNSKASSSPLTAASDIPDLGDYLYAVEYMHRSSAVVQEAVARGGAINRGGRNSCEADII